MAGRKRAASPRPLRTPDGRYIVVNGRLWRAANPNLEPEVLERLVKRLMSARRDVGRATTDVERASARRRVHRAKVALGERGPVWWTDGAPDENRKLVENTSYAAWWRRRRRR